MGKALLSHRGQVLAVDDTVLSVAFVCLLIGFWASLLEASFLVGPQIL